MLKAAAAPASRNWEGLGDDRVLATPNRFLETRFFEFNAIVLEKFRSNHFLRSIWKTVCANERNLIMAYPRFLRNLHYHLFRKVVGGGVIRRIGSERILA